MKMYGMDLAEGSEITNISVPTGATFPANPNNGEMFYLTTGDVGLHVYTSGAWELVAKNSDLSTHDHDTKYVNLIGAQTVGGTKTFSDNIIIQGSLSLNDTALNNTNFVQFNERLEPSAPGAGFGYLYADSADSKLKFKNDAGTVYDLTAAGGGGVTYPLADLEISGKFFRNGITHYGTGANYVNIGFGVSVTGYTGQNYNYQGVLSGLDNEAWNDYSVTCGGRSNEARGIYSFAGGGHNMIASGSYSGALSGYGANVSGQFSVTCGGHSGKPTSNYSIVGSGYKNWASGDFSGVLGGRGNTTSHTYSAAFGSGSNTRSSFDIVVGGVITDTSSVNNNTIRLEGAAGNIKIDGAVTTPEADYAEYFEWADGNVANEDRVGYFVSFTNGQIAKGNVDVIGIISATPAIIGDAADNHWILMYETDDFGRTIMDTYTSHTWHEQVGDELIYYNVYEAADTTKYLEYPNPTAITGTPFAGVIPATDVTTEIIKVPKMNPSFNPNQTYVPREERKEWDPVGLMGKLYVRCAEQITGTHVDADVNGLAVNGTKYRVIEVVNANVARILFFPS